MNYSLKITRILTFISLILLSMQAFAQQVYMTRNGKINFYSKTPLETIDGTNNEVFSAIDIQKGEIAFAVLIKGFHFERALMEEHFNENYMESTKFPKATFKGQILNLDEVKFQKDGTYAVRVEGDLVIHGVTKRVNANGDITIREGKPSAKSVFKIAIKDFNIQVPSVVSEKIAEVIDVTVECSYQPKN